MPPESAPPATIGVLLSGGLDSWILVGDLVRQGKCVQPFYVQAGLLWETAELQGVQDFSQKLTRPNLLALVCLQLPLADLYQGHWSLTGKDVPDAQSPDEAVYLPGRNALLLVKAALWCQLHGIEQLALAPLGTSPFEDASAAFFQDFAAALNRGSPARVEFLLPFAGLTKKQVMQLGAELPLEQTFSCLAPVAGQHCGHCNKCAERQAAFQQAGLEDRTRYAAY